MDRILIQDLLVRCIIGVNDEERRRKQDVLINIVLFADLARAGRSDRIEDTVDYRAIKKQVMTLSENSQFHLIESLAESIAALCLTNRAVSAVNVRIDKPGALRFARSVAVEITRKQT